jgi:transcriptional regulator with XRE-family HTH domain
MRRSLENSTWVSFRRFRIARIATPTLFPDSWVPQLTRCEEAEAILLCSQVDIRKADIPQEDNTSVARIKQEETFSLAVRTIRSRLGLSQAEFASKIGCNQNTVSRYESGKLLPSGAILPRVWRLADTVGRNLLMAYLNEQFELLGQEEQGSVLRWAEESATSRGTVPPSVKARMVRLLNKYEGDPDAAQLFDLAASWLEVEFQMRSLKRAASDAGDPEAL